MTIRFLATAFIAAITLTPSAHAKVTALNANGFTIAHEADLTVTPQQAYDQFVDVGGWWDMAHSYSGDSTKMKMNASPGGLWVEDLPKGGFVIHMRVSQAAPGQSLLLTGGLGPLAFMGVSGSMAVNFKETKSGTKFTVNYAVGGHDPGEFKAMSTAVDGVLGSQIARFASFANTGKPQ